MRGYTVTIVCCLWILWPLLAVLHFMPTNGMSTLSTRRRKKSWAGRRELHRFRSTTEQCQKCHVALLQLKCTIGILICYLTTGIVRVDQECMHIIIFPTKSFNCITYSIWIHIIQLSSHNINDFIIWVTWGTCNILRRRFASHNSKTRRSFYCTAKGNRSTWFRNVNKIGRTSDVNGQCR